MAKQSVITLPDGTVIEISPDLSPEQITAMITALTVGQTSLPIAKTEPSTGKTFAMEKSIEDIWNSSKKEKIALFIRNYLSESLWFNSKDIQEQQLAITGKLTLGETSAIGTYLNRLFESAYLDRKKDNRTVYYRMTDKLTDEYPRISTNEFVTMIENSL